MADLAKLVVSLEAESSKLRQELEKTNRRMKKWEKNTLRSVKRVGSAFKNAFIVGASAAGAGSIFQALGNVAMQAAETEAALGKLNAVIKTTGYAAGFTAEQLDTFARALARETLASTKGVRDAVQVLLTFKSVSGDTFKQTIRLAQDMAASGFGSITSAATQLGKALEDPVKGLTAMSRSGVTFSKAQEDMIKSMVKSGRLLEAQGMILDQIAGQLGGAGKGEAVGLVGSLDSAGQAFDEFWESVGASGLAQNAAAFINEITKTVEYATRLINGSKRDEFNDAFEKRAMLMERINQLQKRGAHRDDIAPLREEAAALKTEMESLQKGMADTINERATAANAAYQARLEAIKNIGAVEDDIVKKLERQKKTFSDLLKETRDQINVKSKNLASGTLVEAINELGRSRSARSGGDESKALEHAKNAVTIIKDLSSAGKLSKQYANSLLNQIGEAGTGIREDIQSQLDQGPFKAEIEWTNAASGAGNTPLPLGASAGGVPLVIQTAGGEYKTTIPVEDADRMRGPLNRDMMRKGSRC